ncbi:HNH endonuclease [Proteiniclasticum sp. BAD-10]|uniref:Putative HNH nuclease YajD n=1 Tax=Proteiniclasticum sediminis TaxID=2804028 RepID=A0A941HQT9_9CLOT|nr:HNH endonuclease [Proteiniclasticum sediminis]MBR0576761.1 HNH endonuclease [Proteiniclasticum sediminis]
MARRYHGSKWDSKREAILKRDEYKCRHCKRYGKVKAATMVHHVKPVDQRPDLYLESRNLISLCGTCHNMMHDRDSDALTATGLEWVQRIWGEE